MTASLLVGDGAGTPLDQGVSFVLVVVTLVLGWVSVQRLRKKSFARLPTWSAWTLAGLAAVSLALAIVLPPIIRPVRGATRPSSAASLTVLSPRPGERFTGNPANVVVRLRLIGGRIVPFTSTKLVPDEGHIHLYLDGSLVSMTLALTHELLVLPGSHTILAEFVAVDHAPFDPRVQARVRFVVTG